MISPQLQKYFDEYAESHQNKVNLAIHKIAIPFIVFHFLAMFTWIPLFVFSFGTLTLAELFLIPVLVFYIFLNKKYAAIFFIFSLLCLFLARYTPKSLVISIAVLAWVIQLLGHGVWEKKAPAFSQNFIQLLVGPLYMIFLFEKKQPLE